MTDLERLVTRLILAIRNRDPARVSQPITIAEIRRDLVPYRLHRKELSLSSSEDYELLILRLIAEEEGLVRTTPPQSAQAAASEVKHLNPDLSLTDLLDDTTIQVLPEVRARLLATAETDSAGEPERPTSPAVPDPIEEIRLPIQPLKINPPMPSPGRLPSIPPIGDLPPVRLANPAPERRREQDRSFCGSCGGRLPAGREVGYCPYCGVRQGAVKCPRCSAQIEIDWRYCAFCGTRVSGISVLG